MDSNAGSRFKAIGLVGIAILLIAIPSGLGIFLLRSSASLPSAVASSAAIPGNDLTAVSDEVYESVLSRPSDTSTTEPSSVLPAASANSRIKVMLDGEPVPIANGSAVPLTEDLQVEVFIAPYPPADFSVDVDLYLTTTNGEPVTDAEFDIEYDMMFMIHGPFFTTPTNLGNGHYLTSFDFFMYGPWVLDTYISVPDRNGIPLLPIAIYVWPGS